jgi:hypothetical protein
MSASDICPYHNREEVNGFCYSLLGCFETGFPNPRLRGFDLSLRTADYLTVRHRNQRIVSKRA